MSAAVSSSGSSPSSSPHVGGHSFPLLAPAKQAFAFLYFVFERLMNGVRWTWGVLVKQGTVAFAAGAWGVSSVVGTVVSQKWGRRVHFALVYTKLYFTNLRAAYREDELQSQLIEARATAANCSAAAHSQSVRATVAVADSQRLAVHVQRLAGYRDQTVTVGHLEQQNQDLQRALAASEALNELPSLLRQVQVAVERVEHARAEGQDIAPSYAQLIQAQSAVRDRYAQALQTMAQSSAHIPGASTLFQQVASFLDHTLSIADQAVQSAQYQAQNPPVP